MYEQLRQYRLYILMFALNLAVLIGVIYLLRRTEPRTATIITPAPPSTATPALVQLQVSGAVLRPGVYKLPLSARVSDALDAAGGAHPDADLGKLNLARKLNDGEALVVPTRTVTLQSATAISTIAVAAQAKLNINAATAEQLDTLRGIGPALAQRIIDYRNQQGPFQKIEDLKQVKGIGDALFNDIKNSITTDTAVP